jgi:hypothetical protein
MPQQQIHHPSPGGSRLIGTKGLLIAAGLVGAVLISALGPLLQEGVGTLFSRVVYLLLGVWFMM